MKISGIYDFMKFLKYDWNFYTFQVVVEKSSIFWYAADLQDLIWKIAAFKFLECKLFF